MSDVNLNPSEKDPPDEPDSTPPWLLQSSWGGVYHRVHRAGLGEYEVQQRHRSWPSPFRHVAPISAVVDQRCIVGNSPLGLSSKPQFLMIESYNLAVIGITRGRMILRLLWDSVLK